MRVAVIGAGSWGTTVAALCSRRAPTVLWARRRELAAAIESSYENPDYLPGVDLPPTLSATDDLHRALTGADLVVMAVPSHGFRTVLERAAPDIAAGSPVLSLTKGIEEGTLLRMTEIVAQVLPEHPPSTVGVLTGPNLAREIVAGQPTATVVAMRDEEVARRIQRLLMGPSLRVYTNPDVVGCEAAGALKNVMALAAGMADGLGFGMNTMATLITRALAEMTRLGVAMGGRPDTFAGLAGMGDLIATCMSPESRNHRVGFGLGRGRSLEEVVAEMRMVAEGVKSTSAVLALARRHGVEMPIAVQVGRVLYEGASVADSIALLMGRAPKGELEDHDPRRR